MLLMRRRMVWVPTLWGSLLVLAAVTLLLVGLAGGAHRFLAVESPARGAQGQGARTLIVEGWLDEPELEAALTVARAGSYVRIITTGGPIPRHDDPAGFGSYAQRTAGWLRAHGPSTATVIAVPAGPTERDRTWHSAVAVREWAAGAQVSLDAVDVLTAGLHARRSRSVYRLALGDAVEVGVIAAPIDDFDAMHWWRSSAGTKAVMGEALSLVWTTCCFWPERPAA